MNQELSTVITELFQYAPSKIVISNKRNSAAPELSTGIEDSEHRVYEKVVITPKLIKNTPVYQAEQFTKTQAFHKNLTVDEISDYIGTMLDENFRQADVFSEVCDMNIKISKKGKVMVSRKRKTGREAPGRSAEPSQRTEGADCPSSTQNTNVVNGSMPKSLGARGSMYGSTYTKSVPIPVINASAHNKKKKRLIEEGTVVAPLIDMGIFTAEGKIVRSMGDKFRQINRFLEIVDDAVEAGGFEELTIVDFGCGKAYLTFILYYYLTYVKKIRATMIGLDLKVDVIKGCNEAAVKYGYENLHFEVGDISKYTATGPIDMVITLHACDTATDYALFNAISWNSRVILSVPCCQHELNAQVKSDRLSALTKYGIIKERFAAIATDSIRASMLEYMGYKTQVLEFVDLSHTPKNLLIRAVKSNVSEKKRRKSLSEAEALIEDFGADQTLYRLLTENAADTK